MIIDAQLQQLYPVERTKSRKVKSFGNREKLRRRLVFRERRSETLLCHVALAIFSLTQSTSLSDVLEYALKNEQQDTSLNRGVSILVLCNPSPL